MNRTGTLAERSTTRYHERYNLPIVPMMVFGEAQYSVCWAEGTKAMQAFLKAIGSTHKDRRKLDDEWMSDSDEATPGRVDLLDKIRFARNKRPSGVYKGDKLVLYASGWKVFFGVATVLTDDIHEEVTDEEEPWPWVRDVEVPLVVPRLSIAPHISEIRVKNTSVRQLSHKHLTDEQYELALDALIRRARTAI